MRACPRSYCIGGNANDKTNCKHNNSERFNSDIIIIVIIIIVIIQPVRNLPLMSHCAEVAADAKTVPGANFPGIVAGPLQEQAGMDALVLEASLAGLGTGITVEVCQLGGKLPANQILVSVSSRVLTAFGGRCSSIW